MFDAAVAFGDCCELDEPEDPPEKLAPLSPFDKRLAACNPPDAMIRPAVTPPCAITAAFAAAARASDVGSPGIN